MKSLLESIRQKLNENISVGDIVTFKSQEAVDMFNSFNGCTLEQSDKLEVKQVNDDTVQVQCSAGEFYTAEKSLFVSTSVNVNESTNRRMNESKTIKKGDEVWFSTRKVLDDFMDSNRLDDLEIDQSFEVDGVSGDKVSIVLPNGEAYTVDKSMLITESLKRKMNEASMIPVTDDDIEMLKNALPQLEALIKKYSGESVKLRIEKSKNYRGDMYLKIVSSDLSSTIKGIVKPIFKEVHVEFEGSGKKFTENNTIPFHSNLRYTHPGGGSNGQTFIWTGIWFDTIENAWLEGTIVKNTI